MTAASTRFSGWPGGTQKKSGKPFRGADPHVVGEIHRLHGEFSAGHDQHPAVSGRRRRRPRGRSAAAVTELASVRPAPVVHGQNLIINGTMNGTTSPPPSAPPVTNPPPPTVPVIMAAPSPIRSRRTGLRCRRRPTRHNSSLLSPRPPCDAPVIAGSQCRPRRNNERRSSAAALFAVAVVVVLVSGSVPAGGHGAASSPARCRTTAPEMIHSARDFWPHLWKIFRP